MRSCLLKWAMNDARLLGAKPDQSSSPARGRRSRRFPFSASARYGGARQSLVQGTSCCGSCLGYRRAWLYAHWRLLGRVFCPSRISRAWLRRGRTRARAAVCHPRAAHADGDRAVGRVRLQTTAWVLAAYLTVSNVCLLSHELAPLNQMIVAYRALLQIVPQGSRLLPVARWPMLAVTMLFSTPALGRPSTSTRSRPTSSRDLPVKQ